jgi:hypothetical protein
MGRTVFRNNCSRCLFHLQFARYMFRPSLAILNLSYHSHNGSVVLFVQQDLYIKYNGSVE